MLKPFNPLRSMTHFCVGKLYHHWFKYWLSVSLTKNHYLNQMLVHCWPASWQYVSVWFETRYHSFHTREQRMDLNIYSANMTSISPGPQYDKVMIHITGVLSVSSTVFTMQYEHSYVFVFVVVISPVLSGSIRSKYSYSLAVGQMYITFTGSGALVCLLPFQWQNHG